MRRIAVALAALALSLPIFAQEQQQPALSERIDVNVVLLDVIVTDSKGNQILGLTKDDFVVKEDGVAQPLDSIDYYTNRKLLNAREENAPFKVEQIKDEPRYFIFFLDKPSDPSALFDQLTLARNAAKQFINEMREGDRVAIAGHDIRLKIYSDFTSDKAQLLRGLEDAARFGPGLKTAGADTGMPSILRNIDSASMIKRTGTVYEALRTLADAVRPIRARKNLILYSPGIADISEDVRAGMLLNRSIHLDPAIRALNAANVSVYPVQLQRDVQPTPYIHQRLEEIASETGGEYFRFNNTFAPAIERIENVNNGYYLLTYRTRKGGRGFQKVNVSVKNPEFRVVARTGYQYGG